MRYRKDAQYRAGTFMDKDLVINFVLCLFFFAVKLKSLSQSEIKSGFFAMMCCYTLGYCFKFVVYTQRTHSG